MLVHGDLERAEKLASAFQTKNLGKINLPELGQTIELD